MRCNMRSVAVVVTLAKRWRKFASADHHTAPYLGKRKRKSKGGTESDTLAESDHKPAFVGYKESHQNVYVCVECREKMAKEAFVSCNRHKTAYCSECVSAVRHCPWCGNAGENERAWS